MLKYQFITKLAQLPFVEKIILYGSRARKDNTEKADIDLAIQAPTANSLDWQKILDIIADADTLLKIDCVRFDTLTAVSPLKMNIEREGILLYEKNT